MTVSDGETLTFDNVLIGEVWLCAGQSNMEMPMKGFPSQPIEGGPADILHSTDPLLHVYQAKRISRVEPTDTTVGQWKTSEPQTIRDFAATASSYDHIFSNPPFYDNSLLNPDPRKAPARHTRTLSYREICAFCATNLAPQGRLSLVLPYEQREELLRCAASFGLYPFRLMSIKTTERKPFRRLIAEFSFTRTQVEEQTLVLQDGDRRSAAYSELTRDFYL